MLRRISSVRKIYALNNLVNSFAAMNRERNGEIVKGEGGCRNDFFKVDSVEC